MYAAVPNAVLGTTAADASDALLSRMLPPGVMHCARLGDGVLVVVAVAAPLIDADALVVTLEDDATLRVALVDAETLIEPDGETLVEEDSDRDDVELPDVDGDADSACVEERDGVAVIDGVLDADGEQTPPAPTSTGVTPEYAGAPTKGASDTALGELSLRKLSALADESRKTV